MVTIYFDLKNKPAGNIRLSGYITGVSPVALSGDAVMPDGTFTHWIATVDRAIYAFPTQTRD